MKIEVSLDGVRLTNVPNEEDLNKEPIYYVYEWFIKETGQIFYVGKGKGNRYKNKNRNELFNKIMDKYECEVRFIKEGLTEYEALTLEEELMEQRDKEGEVLSNIVAIRSEPIYGYGKKYEYMTAPIVCSNQVDKTYFGLEDIQYDSINHERLLKTYIPLISMYGYGHLYIESEEDFIDQDTCEKTINPLVVETTNRIEVIGGKVFRSLAKGAKSVIIFGNITYNSFLVYKEKGYDVYHLTDVIKYLNELK